MVDPCVKNLVFGSLFALEMKFHTMLDNFSVDVILREKLDKWVTNEPSYFLDPCY